MSQMKQIKTDVEDVDELIVKSVKQERIVNWCTKLLSLAQSKKLHLKILNAIIYGNIPFNFIENPYQQDFLQESAPSYQPPSIDMLQGHILTEAFSNLLKKN